MRVLRFFSVLLFSVAAVVPTPVAAKYQDRSGDLPGMTSDSEMATYVAIAGSATAVGLIVGLTGPKPATFKNGSEELTAAGCAAALEQAGGAGNLMKVDRREGEDLYGEVTCDGEGGFLVRTTSGTEVVPASNVKKLEDLAGLSRRVPRKRAASSIMWGGLGVASLYLAGTYDNELESGSKTLNQVLGMTFLGLGAMNFILPNRPAQRLEDLQGPPRLSVVPSLHGEDLDLGLTVVATF